MQGVYIDGRRPKSKREVKEVCKERPEAVELEATSAFGNEYEGPVTDMPEGLVAFVVGPDPYESRKFYLNVERTGADVRVR